MPGADDPAHDQHGRVEQAEAAGEAVGLRASAASLKLRAPMTSRIE